MDIMEKYAKVLKIKEPHKITKYPFNVNKISRTLKKIKIDYALGKNSTIKGGAPKKVIIVFV